MRFGNLPDGTEVYEVVLHNGKAECRVITYGAALRALRVPDGNGECRDIVLGFDSLGEYLAHDGHFGGTIGRFANRIGNARFCLNGREYRLRANDGSNHLHGGPGGFDRQNWEIVSRDETAVTLRLFSPDGQEGYPGDLEVRVTYALLWDGEETVLRLSYEAASDRDTVCSLTNHAYFNLDGHDGGSVEDQWICIHADSFTPVGPGAIPTGEIRPVEGTPMDLRVPVRIGEHIGEACRQLELTGGYDHNFVPDGSLAAEAFSLKSRIRMSVRTDRPGIQFYAGNFIGEGLAGKEGAVYGNRHAFCLETQAYPDAPNQPAFPSAVLRAGETFRSVTEYRFGIVERTVETV